MKFFIDSANIDQIKQANDLAIIDGVTTNPSLMAREGIRGKENVREHYVRICNIVCGDISAEVLSNDYEGMIEEGCELAELHPYIVVKIPCTRDGIRAIKYFSSNGVKTNCTLVFSIVQAMLAAKAGATYVSPFVGRLDDTAGNRVALVKRMVNLYRHYNLDSLVLAASIRSPQHIIHCIEAGADVVTCQLSTLLALYDNPLTEQGIAAFDSAAGDIMK